MRRTKTAQDLWVKRMEGQDESDRSQDDAKASQAEALAAYARMNRVFAHTCSDPIDPLACVRVA